LRGRQEIQRWKRRTESDTKCGSCIYRVVLELIIDETKDGDQQMEEDPDTEKYLPATLVNHPQVPFLTPALWLERDFGDGIGQ